MRTETTKRLADTRVYLNDTLEVINDEILNLENYLYHPYYPDEPSKIENQLGVLKILSKHIQSTLLILENGGIEREN